MHFEICPTVELVFACLDLRFVCTSLRFLGNDAARRLLTAQLGGNFFCQVRLNVGDSVRVRAASFTLVGVRWFEGAHTAPTSSEVVSLASVLHGPSRPLPPIIDEVSTEEGTTDHENERSKTRVSFILDARSLALIGRIIRHILIFMYFGARILAVIVLSRIVFLLKLLLSSLL